MFFVLLSCFRFYYPDESLRFASLANWNHEPATDFQLRDKRIGNSWSAGRDQDRLVWAMCAPTQRAVKSFDRRIVNTKLADAALRFSCEFADAFDGIYLRSQPRKNCRLVTGTCANLQNPALLIDFKQLAHPRDDKGL